MLINVEEERNRRVEDLLDEGIENLRINRNNNNIKLNSFRIKIENNLNNNILKNNNILNLDPYNYQINNVNKPLKKKKNNYICYNGKNTELINNTIEALNTGLSNPENNNQENSNLRKNKIKKKKEIKTEEIKKENLFKKNNSDINLNKKVYIKENKLINEIKNNFSISDEHINKQTLENNINSNLNNLEINKNPYQKNLRVLSSKRISNKSNFKKIYKNFDWKDKYNEIKKIRNNVLNQLKKVKENNNIFENRLNNTNNNSKNINLMKNNLLKKRVNYDKMINKFKLGENIRMIQINLIDKITKEMKEIEQLIYKENELKQ